jgi:integrase
MHCKVALTTQIVRSSGGRRYTYWQLRWFGPGGRRFSENIGRTDEVSKRQANRLRQEKENELRQKPGRRNPGRVPGIGAFLDSYLDSRRTELAEGTITLHEQTARYLKAFFGEHTRINDITRFDAREFKTSLAQGRLAHINKKKYKSIQPITVDLHVRNARTMFNRALDDDLIDYNPFDRLAGGVPPVEKDWHYVTLEELEKLLSACIIPGWRTFLALCRLAGLRRGEALSLQWGHIDWEAGRMTVWAPKTKRRRIVPIGPELQPILRDAFETAEEGQLFVVTGVTPRNVWRDFQALRKRAGVKRYARWCHTLRKNRESDWMAAGFPFHVVVEWMGHSDEVARQHYLRVDENDLAAATHSPIPRKLTQKVTQIGSDDAHSQHRTDPQVVQGEDVTEKAGDGIRTHDVQLGNLRLRPQVLVPYRVMAVF